MSGAVATRNSPTTLARLARWLGGMISPPRAPLFRPPTRERAQHPPRARGGGGRGRVWRTAAALRPPSARRLRTRVVGARRRIGGSRGR